MKRKILALFMIFAIMLSSTSCQKEEAVSQAPPPPPPEYPVNIGETIVQDKPLRVATISPAMTDLIYGLGFGGRVVGVGTGSTIPLQDEWDTFNVAQTGTLLEPDIIAINRCKPDVIFTHTNFTEENLRKLQTMNITVVVVPYAQTIDGVFENYKIVSEVMLGDIKGKSYAEKKISRFKEIIKTITTVSQKNSNQAEAIYLRYPLFTMATGKSFENYILTDILNFKNCASQYTNWTYPADKALELEPDVIFYDKNIKKEDFAENDVYKTTKAITKNNIHSINADYFERTSPQMFMEMILLMYELYPTDMPSDLNLI